MGKRISGAFVAVCLLVGATLADDLGAWEAGPGEWQRQGDILQGKTGHLISKSPFKDFRLTCHAKVDVWNDSQFGIFFRDQSGKLQECYRLIFRKGSLVTFDCMRYPLKQWDRWVSEQMALPAGDWFAVDIQCTGSRTEISINGRKIVQHVDQNPLPEGLVVLWVDKDLSAHFRDVKIVGNPTIGSSLPPPGAGSSGRAASTGLSDKEAKEAQRERRKAEKEEKKKLAALYARLNVAVAKYLDDCNNVCKAWDSGYDFPTFCKYLDDRKASRQKVIDAAAAIPEGDERVQKLLKTCDELTAILDTAGRSGGAASSDGDKAKIKALRKKLKTWRPVIDPPKKQFAE